MVLCFPRNVGYGTEPQNNRRILQFIDLIGLRADSVKMLIPISESRGGPLSVMDNRTQDRQKENIVSNNKFFFNTLLRAIL